MAQLHVIVTALRLSPLLLGALVAGCASIDLAQSDTPQTRASHVRERPARLQLAQLQFGSDALFAYCSSECPRVTPKTVGAAQPHPLPPLAGMAPDIDADAARQPQLSIGFGFASATLTARAREKIDAQLAEARAAERIILTGHTGPGGAPQANRATALARAAVVREYIRDRAPDLRATFRIEARLAQPGQPATAAGNPRRVDVTFVRAGGAS